MKAQHLTSVKASAEICGADVEGADVGSSELVYRPGVPRSGRFRFDIGTAGSITLVLQTLMPVLAFAPGKVELEVTGGTDVKWSPPVDYLQMVALPLFNRFGYDCKLDLVRRGHYPKGGGEIRFTVTPAHSLPPFKGLDPGETLEVGGVSHSMGLPSHVAERQAEFARKMIRARGLPEPDLRVESSQPRNGLGLGSGIVLYARTKSGTILGADSLGERGKPAETVGSEAGRQLAEEVDSRAFVDRHMGDMIVPYMVLADGISEVSVSRVTQHTLTNVRVAEQISGLKFEVEGGIGERGVLRVKGLGLRNP